MDDIERLLKQILSASLGIFLAVTIIKTGLEGASRNHGSTYKDANISEEQYDNIAKEYQKWTGEQLVSQGLSIKATLISPSLLDSWLNISTSKTESQRINDTISVINEHSLKVFVIHIEFRGGSLYEERKSLTISGGLDSIMLAEPNKTGKYIQQELISGGLAGELRGPWEYGKSMNYYGAVAFKGNSRLAFETLKIKGILKEYVEKDKNYNEIPWAIVKHQHGVDSRISFAPNGVASGLKVRERNIDFDGIINALSLALEIVKLVSRA